MGVRNTVTPRRTRKRSEEGAVMLVVMLILLTATAMAAVSLQTTQFELRAAGYNRAALQTQYVSEAGANTSIAWVDATSMDRSFLAHVASWNAQQYPPSMLRFGEPDIVPSNRLNANRTEWQQQRVLTNVIMPPITKPGSTDGTTDLVGTFGPRSNYVPGVDDTNHPGVTAYVVDLYDCRQLPNTGTAGSQVNQGGSGTLQQVQYYCVITSRGRAFVPGAPTKTWTLPAGDFVVNRFTMGHDSRGTIVTPPIILGP
jgi:type II secretory pathway component PulK